jgi:hypothetical protein
LLFINFISKKMQKEVIFIFALIFSLIEISFGIECYRLTQNSQDYVPIANQKFQCPPYVGQCFKFVCMGTSKLEGYKGYFKKGHKISDEELPFMFVSTRKKFSS